MGCRTSFRKMLKRRWYISRVSLKSAYHVRVNDVIIVTCLSLCGLPLAQSNDCTVLDERTQRSWSVLVNVRLQVESMCSPLLLCGFFTQLWQDSGRWLWYALLRHFIETWPCGKALNINQCSGCKTSVSGSNLFMPSIDFWQGQGTDRPLNFLKTKCTFNYNLWLRSLIFIIKIKT